MKKILCILATVAFLLLPVCSWSTIDSSGTVTMEFDLSAHDLNEEAQLWIPYPLSDRDQFISRNRISLAGNIAGQSFIWPVTTGCRWIRLMCAR